MADNKNTIPENNENTEPEIITLFDEDGNEVKFELIGGYVDKGVQYFALIPEGEVDEDGGFDEYIILKQVDDELVEIEDDAEFERIAKVFDEAFDTEYDYDN